MAIDFNGTSDRIQYEHVAAYDGVEKLTISARINPGPVSENFATIFQQLGLTSGPGNDNGLAFIISGVDETKLIIVFRNASSTPSASTATGAIVVGVWTHVWIVYDGTQAVNADRAKLWLNGSSIALTQTGTNPTTLGATDRAFTFGSSDSASANNWDGSQAEVALWANEAMIDPEIISAAVNGFSPQLLGPMPTQHHPFVRHVNDIMGVAGQPTIVGTTVADHPRIIRPSGSLWSPFAAAAAEGAVLDERRYPRGVMRGVLRGVA